MLLPIHELSVLAMAYHRPNARPSDQVTKCGNDNDNGNDAVTASVLGVLWVLHIVQAAPTLALCTANQTVCTVSTATA